MVASTVNITKSSLDNLQHDVLEFSDVKFTGGLAIVDPEDPAEDVGRLPEAMDVLGGEDDLTEADQLGAPAFSLEVRPQHRVTFL